MADGESGSEQDDVSFLRTVSKFIENNQEQLKSIRLIILLHTLNYDTSHMCVSINRRNKHNGNK